MIGSQGFLLQGEDLIEQLFRFRIPALVVEISGEIVQGRGVVGMLFPGGLYGDRQSDPEERFGFGEESLVLSDRGSRRVARD
jgi:hypothetical protein